jgi:prolyl 4-hydroxylase
MFERIVATAPGNRTDLTDADLEELADFKITNYTVTVHSRPSELPALEVSVVNDRSLPPWVITFDNFLTPEECDDMVQLGYKAGFKLSEDVGEEKVDGTVDSKKSSGRTSENAWCSSRSGCRDDDVAQRLHNRMSQVMRIPPENSEDLQLLRYEVGQFYVTHHDYIPHQKDRQCGPRILTFFIYMSDVDAGGGTDFPDLGITVMPKKGRALLWPSVYDSDPMAVDNRLRHQALPVEAGTKFAANGWIHMYDYLGPQEVGCN